MSGSMVSGPLLKAFESSPESGARTVLRLVTGTAEDVKTGGLYHLGGRCVLMLQEFHFYLRQFFQFVPF